jgi:thioredoxin-related protein
VDWRWLDFDEAFESDIGDGKHLVVNFYSTGCFWCKKMDNLTFTDPIISNMLAGGFVGAKVNIASNRKVEWMGDVISERELARIFAVRGTPNTAFVDSTGKIVARVPGYIDPERFKIVLKYIDGYWYNELSFQEYLISEKALQSGSNKK